MLVLTRRIGERVTIGESIEVDVLAVRGHQIRLGIAAPKGIGIWRSELLCRDAHGGRQSETGSSEANAPSTLRSTSNAESLHQVLDRSYELHQTVLDCLSGAELDASPRGEAAGGMCSLAFEHAHSIRVLMGSGCATSAIALVRLQFEAVTRAIWLLYAARNEQIRSVLQELNLQTASDTKSLPTVSPMIDEIGKLVGSQAPEAAHQMLVRFKETSLKALNSFVHAGIHPLQRHVEGVPDKLAIQVQKNSNGLLTMTGMTLAILTGDPSATHKIGSLQQNFADCLPDLVA